jgi:hypothetical protein
MHDLSMAAGGVFLGGGSLEEIEERHLVYGDSFEDLYVRAFLGAVIVEQERKDERIEPALRDLEAVLAQEPALVWAHALRGFLLLRSGRPSEAERVLRIAAEAAPDSGPVAFYQALLLARRGAPARDVVAKLEQANALGYRPFEWQSREGIATQYPEMRDYIDRDELRSFLVGR